MIKRKLISSALILALVMTVAGCGNAKNKSKSFVFMRLYILQSLPERQSRRLIIHHMMN